MAEDCNKYCPIECDQFNLKISQNYLGPLPDDYLAGLGVDTELKDSLIVLSVYYSSLDYSLLSKSPKTKTFDLISNVGGLLGLFLGLGFIHIGELSEIVWEMFYHIYYKFHSVKTNPDIQMN